MVFKRAKTSIFRIIFQTVGQFFALCKNWLWRRRHNPIPCLGKSKKTLLNKRVFLSFRKCSNQFFVESFENGISLKNQILNRLSLRFTQYYHKHANSKAVSLTVGSFWLEYDKFSNLINFLSRKFPFLAPFVVNISIYDQFKKFVSSSRAKMNSIFQP